MGGFFFSSVSDCLVSLSKVFVLISSYQRPFSLENTKKVNTWWNTHDYETYRLLHIHNHPKGKIVDVMMASFSQSWAPAHIFWVSSRSGEAGPRILGFFTPNSSRTFPFLHPPPLVKGASTQSWFWGGFHQSNIKFNMGLRAILLGCFLELAF